MEAQSVHVHGKIRRISRSCFSYIVFIRWINKDSPQHTTIWKQQQYTLIANIQQHTTMYNNIQQWFNNIQQSTTTIYNNLQYVVNSIHTPDFENSHVTTRQRNAQAISPWQRSSNASPVTSKTGIGFFTHIAVSMLCLVPYATSLHGSVRRLRCTMTVKLPKFPMKWPVMTGGRSFLSHQLWLRVPGFWPISDQCECLLFTNGHH